MRSSTPSRSLALIHMRRVCGMVAFNRSSSSALCSLTRKPSSQSSVALPSKASILLTTTTCGIVPSCPVPYLAISLFNISKSATGSLLVASTKCRITWQRSTCLRKACPKPTPWAAPFIKPGTSHSTNPSLPAPFVRSSELEP
jgi:hypothetical protein